MSVFQAGDMKKTTEQQYEQVSQELKELWEIEMDLLARFARVCEKHQLQWYADGGTRCPIEEHYALPKDGYCHLWEKRNVTDDDYPERREE